MGLVDPKKLVRGLGWIVCLVFPVWLTACQHSPAHRVGLASGGLAAPIGVAEVEAVCAPPVGWQGKSVKGSLLHSHYVWVSPSGDTAYGVIRIRLPLPIGPNLVLWQFVEEMRKSEKVGNLISKEEDPGLPGIRFVADGSIYRMHGNMVARGFTAWAIYAGTIRENAVDAHEFDLAVRAREGTITGIEPPGR